MKRGVGARATPSARFDAWSEARLRPPASVKRSRCCCNWRWKTAAARGYPTIAGLLRLPPTDTSDLATLIRMFLFAWDGGKKSSAQGLEGDSVAAWLDPLPLPVRRPA